MEQEKLLDQQADVWIECARNEKGTLRDQTPRLGLGAQTFCSTFK